MAKDTPKISAQTREKVGTRYSRRLRQEGRLPAVIYGHKSNPVAISVDETETISHITHGAHVMEIDVEGGSTETCLVKDLQFGYLGDNVVHVDFTRVDLDEIVTIIVKLDLRGQLAGTKKANTAMVTDLNDVEVSCPVRHIPEAFRVDLESFDESVTVGDIELPEHVTILTNPDSNIAHIEVQAGEDSEDDDAAEGDAPAETKSDS
jgi:large subunit ribosomal protein L25